MRYGFPMPQRTPAGQRIYSQQILEDLLLVCQRTSGGKRPGKVIREFISGTYRHRGPETENTLYQDGINHVLAYDFLGLRRWFGRQRATQSTVDFIEKIASPMARQVGDLWFSGNLPIFAEHMFSEEVETALKTRVQTQRPPEARPRILLVAPAGERHLAGLRMACAVLEAEGENPLLLQPDLPTPEIVAAANSLEVVVVGLTASICYPPRLLTRTLMSLRKALAATTAVWAGGSGIANLPRLPGGISAIRNMAHLLELRRSLPTPQHIPKQN